MGSGQKQFKIFISLVIFLVGLSALIVIHGCTEKQSGVSKTFKPRLLAAKLYDKAPPGSPNVLRRAANPIAQLKSGQFDYVFDYKSLALQSQVPFVKLPAEINLGAEKFDGYYRRAPFQASDGNVKKGTTIEYVLSVANKTPHQKLAQSYLRMFLGAEGKAVLGKNGLQPIAGVAIHHEDQMPAYLKPILQSPDARDPFASNPQKPDLQQKGAQKTDFHILHTAHFSKVLVDFKEVFESQFPSANLVHLSPTTTTPSFWVLHPTVRSMIPELFQASIRLMHSGMDISLTLLLAKL